MATGRMMLKASPVLIQPIQGFKTFNNKRNKSVYDVAGAVSDPGIGRNDKAIKLATELKDTTIAWCRNSIRNF